MEPTKALVFFLRIRTSIHSFKLRVEICISFTEQSLYFVGLLTQNRISRIDKRTVGSLNTIFGVQKSASKWLSSCQQTTLPNTNDFKAIYILKYIQISFFFSTFQQPLIIYLYEVILNRYMYIVNAYSSKTWYSTIDLMQSSNEAHIVWDKVWVN